MYPLIVVIVAASFTWWNMSLTYSAPPKKKKERIAVFTRIRVNSCFHQISYFRKRKTIGKQKQNYLKTRTNRRELGRFGCFFWKWWEKSCYKRTIGSTQQVLMFWNHIILVFIQKLIRLIHDLQINFNRSSQQLPFWVWDFIYIGKNFVK